MCNALGGFTYGAVPLQFQVISQNYFHKHYGYVNLIHRKDFYPPMAFMITLFFLITPQQQIL